MLKQCSIDQFAFSFLFDIHAFEGLRCFSSRIPYLFPILQFFRIVDHCFDAFFYLTTHLSSEMTWKQSKVMVYVTLKLKNWWPLSSQKFVFGILKQFFSTLIFTASLRSFNSFLGFLVFSVLSRGNLILPLFFFCSR